VSFAEDTASLINIATEVAKQTTGQNAPAPLSQTVPLQRKYWAMPRPRMHGMTTNTIAVAIHLRGLVEFSIRCSFRKTERKGPDCVCAL
jgi:hypothetical protein